MQQESQSVLKNLCCAWGFGMCPTPALTTQFEPTRDGNLRLEKSLSLYPLFLHLQTVHGDLRRERRSGNQQQEQQEVLKNVTVWYSGEAEFRPVSHLVRFLLCHRRLQIWHGFLKLCLHLQKATKVQCSWNRIDPCWQSWAQQITSSNELRRQQKQWAAMLCDVLHAAMW